MGEESKTGATVEDIEAIMACPLTDTWKAYTPKLLARAMRVINREITKAGVSPDAESVADVQASMVARALMVSGGMRSEADGEYSYTMNDHSLPADGLYLSYRDREALGLDDSGIRFYAPQYGSTGGVK